MDRKTKKMARNLLRNRKGTTMVELAIVLPLLLVVLFAIIEFSIALYDKAVLTNASREGARAGIVSQSPRVDDGVIRGVVINYASNYLITFPTYALQATDIIINPIGSRNNMPFGTPLTVTVNYQYNFLVFSRLINYFFGGTFGPISLSATTVMKLE
jgi:Flp pilus assembly protein TadG